MRRTKQDWAKVFKQFRESGLNGADFCRLNKIGQAAFYKQRSKLFGSEAKARVEEESPIELVDITNSMATDSSSGSLPTLRLQSASGLVLEVYL